MKIGYAICVGPTGSYEQVCRPALDKYRDVASPVFTVRGADSQFSAYNTLLDQAAQAACDALVLLHDDVELRTNPAAIIEQTFADESIALLGTLGGLGAVSLAWWRELAGRRGYIEDRKAIHDHSEELSEVHAIDDVFLVASRWTIENVRFRRNRYQGFEGLGVIMSTQIRAVGKRVAVRRIDVMHHNDGTGFNSVLDWRRNELRWHRDFFGLNRLELLRNLVADAAVPALGVRIAFRRLLGRIAGGLPAVPNGESGEPVVDRYVENWLRQAQKLHGRARPARHPGSAAADAS